MKKAVVKNMEGLKTVSLDSVSDRGIWEDFAYLDLSCLQAEKMLGVCGSFAPTLHSEGINSNARASLCGLGVFNSFGTATSAFDKRLV